MFKFMIIFMLISHPDKHNTIFAYISISEYSKESRKEVFFRILAVITIILFPISLLICFRVSK